MHSQLIRPFYFYRKVSAKAYSYAWGKAFSQIPIAVAPAWLLKHEFGVAAVGAAADVPEAVPCCEIPLYVRTHVR